MSTKQQYENIPKKLSYIDTSIYMQWWARKVNKDEILMQKHTHPQNRTNATNVHHQQYSSYNDTPNMKAKH